MHFGAERGMKNQLSTFYVKTDIIVLTVYKPTILASFRGFPLKDQQENGRIILENVGEDNVCLVLQIPCVVAKTKTNLYNMLR